jgi:NTE family protein
MLEHGVDPVAAIDKSRLPGRVVLVFQGGGALGAYQIGVYEAMHTAGLEPDWVIGTSIGALDGALIAGNPPAQRLDKLLSFWNALSHDPCLEQWAAACGAGKALANLVTLGHGIPGFFQPNLMAWLGPFASLGTEWAAYYQTLPLKQTLAELIDYELLNAGQPRLTVGAVNVRTGAMRYFDSREQRLEATHLMASGALPPAFPAVRIDGDPYWDGGIYSNTPVEAVMDDQPRRSSVIFAVQMWNADGPEPASLWQVSERQKDIQYASRVESHIARQQQIHSLRHVIRELVKRLPEAERAAAEIQELAAWGCGTTMHVIKLSARRLDGEDQLKDIDFSRAGIQARRQAGYADTMRALTARPWEAELDPVVGISIYDAAG